MAPVLSDSITLNINTKSLVSNKHEYWTSMNQCCQLDSELNNINNLTIKKTKIFFCHIRNCFLTGKYQSNCQWHFTLIWLILLSSLFLLYFNLYSNWKLELTNLNEFTSQTYLQDCKSNFVNCGESALNKQEPLQDIEK